MRNIAVNDVDDLPRRVLALGSPANTQLERHSHRRAQFLYAMNGLMKVETDDGQWLVPHSGVWIPATRPHRVLMPGSAPTACTSNRMRRRVPENAARCCRSLPCYISCC